MRIKPSMPHVEGMILLIKFQGKVIAYLGQVRPDRNKNTTEENTITTIEDSLSFANG